MAAFCPIRNTSCFGLGCEFHDLMTKECMIGALIREHYHRMKQTKKSKIPNTPLDGQVPKYYWED